MYTEEQLKTSMVLNKENLSSYRYEYDSWSEDDESSSTSSDTSSGSDFFQMVVESSSGPKNIPEIKTKGELGLEDLPPIEDLSIEIPKEDMMLIGKIHAKVEKMVVVHAMKGMKALDIDSVLFLAHDKPLGRVYDVFGPVVEPFYCIRFNTVEQLNEKIIEVGANVFFAPEKNDITSYVFVDELQKEKGSDASWKYNNEPPEECLDFSDDEQEKEARRKRINKNRNRQFSGSFDVSAKRPSLVTNFSYSQQNLRDRPTTPLLPSPISSINTPTATTFSSSRPFYPPPSPSSSVIGAQKFAPFSGYHSHPAPSPSPSVIDVNSFTPFSSGYRSQPPPSSSISVVAAQGFSPFPNASISHPPSPSVFTAQRFVPFSSPPPSLSPTAPRFTPFSNYYPGPPPPPSSPVFSPSRFTSSSNSYPPPPPSPVFLSSRFKSFSNAYPTCPPPSPSIAAPAFNPFSSPYPAHIPPPPLPILSSNSGVFPEPKLPLFTSQSALQRHPISSSNLQPHSVNHTTSSSQHYVTPIISPYEQYSFSPQTAMQRPAPPPHHVFGQVTLMSSLPPSVSIPPPVNPWNKSPTPLTENVRPNTSYMPR